jgi:signal transduction histidine kinase
MAIASWWNWLRCVALAVLLAGPVAAVQAQVHFLDRAVASVHTRTEDKVLEVSLPYHWDRHNRDQAGAASFQMFFSMPRLPAQPMALFIPQIGSAYEIWLNDALIQRMGDLHAPDTDDFSRSPRYVDIPGKLLREQNLLRIDIRADAGRRAGLDALTLGPQAQVSRAYQSMYDSKVVGSLAIAMFSLLVGLSAFALWTTQVLTRNGRIERDGLYLAACIAELSFALRVGELLLDRPPLAWPQWSAVMTCASACWFGGMVVFCCHIGGWERHRFLLPLARSVWLFFGFTAVCVVLAAGLRWSLALSLWYGTVAILFGLFTVRFCWAAVKPGASSVHRAVALAAALNAAAGVRDLVFFRFSDAYGGQTWVRYSSAAFGLTLAYIVIQRFRTANAQLRELSASLAARIAQKEAELAKTYGQLAQTAGKQARAAERTRILRDMHDGVGAHLSSAIRQLESGRTDDEQLLHTLRDSLDQLKLSIDAINIPPGDVTALLAGLRYRLEPRFAACDLELQWAVDEVGVVRGYDAPAMRHLQFMLFEALSNVLQHAQARVLRIEACASGNGAQLRIIDDGRGFDVGRPLRRGLASMHERAAAIGAKLALQSRPGQTVVDITLNEKDGSSEGLPAAQATGAG